MAEKKKSAYVQKLLDPRWQKKRLEIFNRDGFKCSWCGETEKTLHIHHKLYIRGRDPWEYDNSHLIAICEYCHEIEHSSRAEVEKEFCDYFKLMGFNSGDMQSLCEDLKRHSENPHSKEVLSTLFLFMLMPPSRNFSEKLLEVWRNLADEMHQEISRTKEGD